MKTKVNEIPLVGPKGRKELIERINELEAQITEERSRSPHAIHLSDSPQPSMTTVAALAEIGLTLSEIEAAERG